MTQRNPWGGNIGKAAVLKVARKICERDGVSWLQALRQAQAWAKSKTAPQKPADKYAALRRRGIVSPLDASADAAAHFARASRRSGGSKFWGGR